jgi:hypothetical protein
MLLRACLIALSLLAFVSINAQGTRRFVSVAGPTNEANAATATSWATACNDLQAVINASSNGDEIWVSAGTYYPNRSIYDPTTITLGDRSNAFMLKSGVRLYGGFPSTADDVAHNTLESRVQGQPYIISQTILSGDIDGNPDTGDAINGFGGMDGNARHVVVALGTSMGDSTVFDGFTITGGNANTSFTDTVNNQVALQFHGGGVYLLNSSIIMDNLVITGNCAHICGGGLTSELSEYWLSNSIVSNNKVLNNNGAGIYGVRDKGSGVHIFNVKVLDNRTYDFGGGIYHESVDSLRMANVLVKGNMARIHGGVSFSHSTVALLSNFTITGNVSTDSITGGIGTRPSLGPINIANSIIYGNIGGEVGAYDYGHNYISFVPIYSNCLIEGISNVNWGVEAADGGNNIDGNPCFANPANGDYTLLCNSPAINAGDTLGYKLAMDINTPLSRTSPLIDLNRNYRLFGSYIDMGAYETNCLHYVQPDSAGIVYVHKLGRGLKNGSSWSNAYSNLADPLKVADMQRKAQGSGQITADTIRQIWVGAGTYYPLYKAAEYSRLGDPTDERDRAFVLVDKVKLYGGFPSTANDAVHTNIDSRGTSEEIMAAGLTVLSGDIDRVQDAGTVSTGLTGMDNNVRHVVIAAGATPSDSVLMDGFTVTGGNAIDFLSIDVNAQTILNSTGGGLFIAGLNCTLNNIKIKNNRGFSGAGGLLMLSARAYLSNVSITNNEGVGIAAGGGAAFSSSNITANKLTVRNNSASSRGGGIYISNGPFTAYNSLIAGNKSQYGSAINIETNAVVRLTNVSIAGNHSQSSTALRGGVNLRATSSLEMNNCIVWGNTAMSDESNITKETNVTIAYANSIVGGSSTWPAGFATDGGGNMDTVPHFVRWIDPRTNNAQPTAEGNYRLHCISPAIDAGDSLAYMQAMNNATMAGQTDLENNLRQSGTSIDMGAYEANWLYCIFPDAAGTVYVKEQGRGLMDGMSWKDAYPNLADPLLIADMQRKGLHSKRISADTIRQIWVGAGTYYPLHKAADSTTLRNPTDERDRAFVLVDKVKLYGGFPHNANDSVHTHIDSRGTSEEIMAAGLTVLSGDIDGVQDAGTISTGLTGMNNNVRHLVIATRVTPSDSVLMDGFTVTGGNASGFERIILNGHEIVNSTGGGMYIFGMKCILNNIKIQYNKSSNGGSGICLLYAEVKASSLSITDNEGVGSCYGAGIQTSVSTFTADKLRVENNYSSRSGGGIHIGEGSFTASNSIIAGNSATYGGAINATTSAVIRLTNTTVAGNYAAYNTTGTGGLFLDIGSSLDLNNSIVWGNNTPSTEGNIYKGSNVTIAYANSIVGRSSSWPAGFATDAGGNMDTVPNFVRWIDPRTSNGRPTVGGDYRLRCASPAINAGNTAAYSQATNNLPIIGQSDLLYHPRLYGSSIDMGAYENSDTTCVYVDTLGIVYVNPLKSGDGSSWELAWPDLAMPMHIAHLQSTSQGATTSSAEIHQIWVAAGTYYPAYSITPSSSDPRDRTFRLPKRVQIYGGFPHNANSQEHTTITSRGRKDSIIDGRLSVLSGEMGLPNDPSDNAYHVLVGLDLDLADNSLIDGFTLTEGCAFNSSTGNNSLRVDTTDLPRAFGGAALLYNATATFRRMNITANHALGVGANRAAGAGMAIFNSSNNIITDSKISANEATSEGGGILLHKAAAYISRTLINGNAAASGAAIHCEHQSVAFSLNVTIAGNHASSPSNATGGMVLADNSSTQMNNTLIWGNTGSALAYNAANQLNIGYNLIQGIDTRPTSGLDGRDTANAPYFVEWINPDASGWTPNAQGDYRLRCKSAAVDAGNVNMMQTWSSYGLSGDNGAVDLAGQKSIYGTAPDIGAYESQVRFCIQPDSTGTVYVNTLKTGRGSSWELAYPNLADPLLFADMQRKHHAEASPMDTGDTIRQIWVAAGTYYPLHKAAEKDDGNQATGDIDRAFVLVKGVKIFGGFPDNASTALHPSPESRFDSLDCHSIHCLPPTILSGDLQKDDLPNFINRTDNSCHIVIAAGLTEQDSVSLDGFYLRGGYHDTNNPILVTISVNNETTSRQAGAGILNVNANYAMLNIIIEDNCGEAGGGIANIDSKLRMDRVGIRNNRTYRYGAALFNISSYGTINGVDMSNTLIHGNKSDQNSIVHNDSTYLNLNNVSIVANNTVNGGALYNTTPAPYININNSVIYGHGKGTSYLDNVDDRGQIQYHNSFIGDLNLTSFGGLNGSEYPYFLGFVPTSQAPTALGNYGLQSISPMAESGDSTKYRLALGINGSMLIEQSEYAWDYTGQKRIQGTRLDIGAIEARIIFITRDSVYIITPFADSSLCLHDSISITAQYSNPDIIAHAQACNLYLDYQWEYTADTARQAFAPLQLPAGAPTAGTVACGTIADTIHIHPIEHTQAGYYRLAVSNSSGYGQNFIIYSRPVHVAVSETPPLQDLRIYIRPQNLAHLSLSKYIDTLSLPAPIAISWTALYGSPPLVQGTEHSQGLIDVSSWSALHRTYAYQYTITACGHSSARAYVHVIDSYHGASAVEVCTAIESSSCINLNSIFGIESTSEQWTFPDDPDAITSGNVSIATTHNHSQARIFDARSAYTQATNPAYSYNGSSDVKQFKIRYTADDIDKTITFIVRRQ